MTLANFNEPHHALLRQKDMKESNIQEIGYMDGEMRRCNKNKKSKISHRPDKCSYLLAALFQSKNTYDHLILMPTLFSLFCLITTRKKLDAEGRAVAKGIILNVT